MFKNFHKNKYNSEFTPPKAAGFTLIELLVVIVIFMIITSITIFSYGKFNSSLSIQNLADDIALSVRRAQGFAIGVRGAGGLFTDGYGIHFTANPNLSEYAGSNKSFILFADMNTTPQNEYNHNPSDNTCGNPTTTNECIEVLSIKSADQIELIYLNDESTYRPQTSTLDILFKRPNPEPIFCYRSNPENSTCDESSNISSVKIKISNISNSEIYKMITISNNGQISVSSSN